MGEPILVDPDALEALIDKRIAERDAARTAAQRRAMQGKTPNCNCRAEGYRDRALHQFGCPYGGQKPISNELKAMP